MRIAALLSFVLCFSAATLQAQISSDPTELQNQKAVLQLQLDVLNLQKSVAAAQAAPSASSALSDQLTAQKAILDLKSSIVTDQVNTAKTAIGSIDTSKLPSGTVTLNSVNVQPTILGYDALEQALNSIDISHFCASTDQKIVLGPGSLDDITILTSYQSILGDLIGKLGKFKTVPDYNAPNARPQILPAAIFAGVDAVVALGSLFKTDVTMNGASITPDAKAARFLMAKALAQHCTVLDVNDFVGPTLTGGGTFVSKVNDLDSAIDAANTTETGIKAKIADFTKAETDAQTTLTKAKSLSDEIAAAQKKLADPKTSAADQKALTKTINDDTATLKDLDVPAATAASALNQRLLNLANNDVAVIDALSATGAKILAALYKVDDSSIPFLTRMMKAEALSTKIIDAKVLTLSVSEIGGNSITRKNAFHTSIQFGGGVVVEYQLKAPDGLTVLASGQATRYTVQNEKAVTVAHWP